MKVVLRKDDLPGVCFECNAPVPRSARLDINNPRLEPDSLYWNEEKFISFCGAQHSLDNYERDRNAKA